MCVGCMLTQAPVCAVSGSCTGGIMQVLTIIFVMLGVAIGTARLWLFSVTQKIAPFFNKSIS